MAKEHSVYELNRIQQYIMQMRPVLKKEALFSDGTKDYRNPTEPEAGEKVTIRFRTGKNNVDIVWLCTDCEHYKMKKTESDREFDYYAVEMTMGEEPFYYYFEVASGLLHVFFDRYGEQGAAGCLPVLHHSGIFHTGVVKGSRHVPDPCGSFLQW